MNIARNPKLTMTLSLNDTISNMVSTLSTLDFNLKYYYQQGYRASSQLKEAFYSVKGHGAMSEVDGIINESKRYYGNPHKFNVVITLDDGYQWNMFKYDTSMEKFEVNIQELVDRYNIVVEEKTLADEELIKI